MLSLDYRDQLPVKRAQASGPAGTGHGLKLLEGHVFVSECGVGSSRAGRLIQGSPDSPKPQLRGRCRWSGRL
jgi:hypothetical protein